MWNVIILVSCKTGYAFSRSQNLLFLRAIVRLLKWVMLRSRKKIFMTKDLSDNSLTISGWIGKLIPQKFNQLIYLNNCDVGHIGREKKMENFFVRRN